MPAATKTIGAVTGERSASRENRPNRKIIAAVKTVAGWSFI